MMISLYDSSVLSYLQTLGAVSGFLDKGFSYCKDNSIDPETLVESRLFHDMFPFRFQIQSVAHHSIGAIEGIKNGVFRPPKDLPNHDYQDLKALIADTLDGLMKLTPEDVNAYAGSDVVFEVRDMKLPFTAENFVLSFSLPNFHFHAATAYDILRSKGVPVGKLDFLGAMRLKT
ncbi:MAG: DUF1993 domain-containing protein [Sterolibacterium sp.]